MSQCCFKNLAAQIGSVDKCGHISDPLFISVTIFA